MRHYWANKYSHLVWIISVGLLGLVEGSVGSFSYESGYEVYFTPQDNCTAEIINTIRKAKRSIDVQAYFLTSQPIIQTLVDAKARGVEVKVLIDKNHPENQKGIGMLSKAKIPIWIDQRSGIAHNKVMVIDQKIVITGSFNFTHAANHKNRENLLIIRDKQLANDYTNNWYQCQLRSAKKRLYSTKVETVPWVELLEQWMLVILRYFNDLLVGVLG